MRASPASYYWLRPVAVLTGAVFRYPPLAPTPVGKLPDLAESFLDDGYFSARVRFALLGVFCGGVGCLALRRFTQSCHGH